MRSQSWLSSLFSWMIGIKPGSGMGLMMVVFGLLTILTMLSGYVFPAIRNIEDLLPDHDTLLKVESTA